MSKLVNSLCIGAGHAATGKGASGAVGYLSESDEARRIRNGVILQNGGKYAIKDCTVDNGTQSAVLTRAVKLANQFKCDVDIQIHFNACKRVGKDGRTKGVEALVYAPSSTKAMEVARQLTTEISAKMGVTNRGIKYRKDLYFLKKTSKPAVILEVCFCDDEDDYAAYINNNGRQVCIDALLNLLR